jgi:hypothetical protein
MGVTAEEAHLLPNPAVYEIKGAPSARHAYGRNRQRELARATGGESRAAGGR